MLRIAHISDLHFEHPEVREQNQSLLQWLASVVGKEIFETKVNTRGYDSDKLKALKNILCLLQPDLILVTGDLTNFGDRQSFKLVVESIEELKELAKVKHILCVPGNHDSLVERAKYIKGTWSGKLIIRLLAKFIKAVDIPTKLSRKFSNESEDDSDLSLLQGYCEFIQSRYGEVNPSQPFFISAGWGEVAFFLFNSTNDPGLMANEGRIGIRQFNTLNEYLQNPTNEKRLSLAVRIALLHHHPVSAPDAQTDAAERAYNWMKDGSQFIQYLNRNDFHFILHGHEHTPYQCYLNYRTEPNPGVRIVAAGSALKGDASCCASFNVIDLLSPFEARLRRFDYIPTGYDKKPQLDVQLPIRPLSEIRLSEPEEPEILEDIPFRNFIRTRKEALVENHLYDLLDYQVTIKEDQLYIGEYRRVGKVVGEDDDEGPVFIVTGSPPMEFEALNVRVTENISGSRLGFKTIKNYPNQKIIQVYHRRELAPGDSFDITLSFQWQASDFDPNYYDGINLTYFRHPVGKLQYRVSLPWMPFQAKVRALGIDEFKPEYEDEEPEMQGDQSYIYKFKIENPLPVAYLIYFEPAEQ